MPSAGNWNNSAYASLPDLEVCHAAGIELFAPWQENDYSQQKRKKKGNNQFTQLPKCEFIWEADEQQFHCPQGHGLKHCGTRKVRCSEYDLIEILCTCSPEHCLACLWQLECTRSPHEGHTLSRLEN